MIQILKDILSNANVLPYPDDLVNSAQSLDNIRLSAQCKEGVQLLCGMENLDEFIKTNDIKIGHSNHLVFEYYHDNVGGMEFLTEYLFHLCREYYYRFGKQHQSFFTLGYFNAKYDWESFNEPDEYGGYSVFKLAYIKGQRNKDQIITTENVDEFYQKLLCEKWDNDKVAPKWINRDTPEFYEKEINNDGQSTIRTSIR